MKFNILFLLSLLLVLPASFKLFSMEEKQTNSANRLLFDGPASDLKFLVTLGLLEKDQSTIMSLPIPEELKEFVLEQKKLMTVDGLLEATKNGDIEMVKSILNFGRKFGITVDSKNTDGDTPAIVAARFNKPELAELFAQKGADMFAPNNNGVNGLQEASKHESTSLTLLYFWHRKLRSQQETIEFNG